MTTYGLQLKDENGLFEVQLNPARSDGDRVGLVIHGVTHWMHSKNALALHSHLDQCLRCLNYNSPALDLGSHGISSSITVSDAKALSAFLLKLQPILIMDSRAGV